MQAAQLALQQAKANLAKIEADVPFLMGAARWTSVAFSPDGRTIATEDPARRVLLWDVETGKQLRYTASVVRQPQAEKKAIPLGAALQWLEDSFSYRFVVRDYGIVLVPGPRLPPGAVLLLDLWKNPGEKEGAAKAK